MNRILFIPTDIRTLLREAPDQLGHLFWMSLIASALGLLGWGPWVFVLVMGVDLMSYNVQVVKSTESWLRHGIWGWVGLGLWVVGTFKMLPVIQNHFQGHTAPFDVIGPTYYALIIGTQLISIAIEKLKRDEWHGAFPLIAFLGGAIAFVPIFL